MCRAEKVKFKSTFKSTLMINTSEINDHVKTVQVDANLITIRCITLNYLTFDDFKTKILRCGRVRGRRRWLQRILKENM